MVGGCVTSACDNTPESTPEEAYGNPHRCPPRTQPDHKGPASGYKHAPTNELAYAQKKYRVSLDSGNCANSFGLARRE